jgi:hypothetical protein
MKTKLGDSDFLCCDPNFLSLQETLCGDIEDQTEFVHSLVTNYPIHAETFVTIFVKEIVWNGVHEAKETMNLLAEGTTKGLDIEKHHRAICDSRPQSRGFGE